MNTPLPERGLWFIGIKFVSLNDVGKSETLTVASAENVPSHLKCLNDKAGLRRTLSVIVFQGYLMQSLEDSERVKQQAVEEAAKQKERTAQQK